METNDLKILGRILTPEEKNRLARDKLVTMLQIANGWRNADPHSERGKFAHHQLRKYGYAGKITTKK